MRHWLLSLLIVHLAACSSMQTVALRDVEAGGESSPVQIGDRVEVATHGNEKLSFAVTGITPDGLAGQFGYVRFDDIRRLRMYRPGQGGGEQAGWILGVLAAAALVALVASADSVSVCSGTPCPPEQ